MSTASMQKSILRNIERYKVDVTLLLITDGSIDFTTGKPLEIIERVDLHAVVTGFSSNEIRDGIIDIGDLKCTLVHYGDIKIGDKVEIGTDTFMVLNARKMIRGTTLLKQTLHLRK